MNPAERRYSIYDKELLGVKWACEKFRSMLLDCGEFLLLFSESLLLIALLEQRTHHQLQRVLVAGQFRRVRSNVTH